MGILDKTLDRLLRTRVDALATQRVSEVIQSKTEQEIQAKSIMLAVERYYKKRKTEMEDPMLLMGQDGRYTEKPQVMSFAALREVARQNPIVAAIINTRINQVLSFSQQSDIREIAQGKPMGFKITHKYKQVKKMTKAEKARAQELENIISNCGYTDRVSPRDGEIRDKFPAFLQKLVRERLTIDQACMEKVPNVKRQPAELWVVDGATIKRASREDRRSGRAAYVQVMHEEVIATYTHDEMAMCIANPRSDILSLGYGYSELEQLVRIVTAHLNADTYNMKFFSQGLGIAGILNLMTKEGQFPEDQMELLREHLRALARGVDNAHRVPVTNVDKMEFVNLKPSNRDMEYQAWLEYLIKVSCAVYQINPSEINFDMNRGIGGDAAMFEKSPEAQVKYSKDKGLRPLLQWLEAIMNEHVIEKYDENFMFIFVGLDEPDEGEVVKIRAEEVASYKTLDEVREEANLPALGEEAGGNLILNPQYIQEMGAQRQEAQMQEQQAQEGQGEGNESDSGEDEDEEIDADYNIPDDFDLGEGVDHDAVKKFLKKSVEMERLEDEELRKSKDLSHLVKKTIINSAGKKEVVYVDPNKDKDKRMLDRKASGNMPKDEMSHRREQARIKNSWKEYASDLGGNPKAPIKPDEMQHWAKAGATAKEAILAVIEGYKKPDEFTSWLRKKHQEKIASIMGRNQQAAGAAA